MAVLLLPFVLFIEDKALLPKAVLVAIAFPPRPTVNPFTTTSLLNVAVPL